MAGFSVPSLNVRRIYLRVLYHAIFPALDLVLYPELMIPADLATPATL